jgi:hypothetical protein
MKNGFTITGRYFQINKGHAFRLLLFMLVIFSLSKPSTAQELYVFSEPASNMPAKALSIKYNGKFLQGYHSGKTEQRQALAVQMGLNKKWMLRAGTTISDMYSHPVTQWESVNLYTKYRFLSKDGVHKHFRAAAFLEASYSRNDLFYDELSLEGDQSGVQAGLVFTQLLHKLALSSTLSILEVIHQQRREDNSSPGQYPYSSFNYSLSAGYLLFPVKYVSYKQTNLNLYLELLGNNTLDKKLYFVDLAPAIQLIFSSNTKVNAGYRFQLNGNMHRMATESFLIGVETTFLNVLKPKRIK